MIPWLDEINTTFPDCESALTEPDGLLAAGGSLEPETLIHAYSLGIFPWYNDPDPILWWSPNPRCVLHPKDVHVSGSMKKLMRKNTYNITFDTAFEKVINACALPRPYSEETWIMPEMIDAYCQLYNLGIAHSVEVWEKDTLIAGLYGVHLGKVFFGESMFSTKSNTSKLAFIHLCQNLNHAGFELIDCQVESEHLLTLGAQNIPRDEFLKKLALITKTPPTFSPWEV